jgi:hypothetical protein
MTKSDKIREYFRKHPNTDVAAVASKFDASRPMTYKLRSQVQLESKPMPGLGRKVTLSRSQLEIANKLGIDPKEYIRAGLDEGMLQYDDEREMEATETDNTVKSALEVQVAGDHYRNMKIQPVVYIHKNGIPFIEGCIIKYASRWRDKGGIKDLEKIKHFADLLIELEGVGR